MKKVTSVLLLLLLCFPAYSQAESLTDSQTEQTVKQIGINFDLNSDVIDPDYKNNREQLNDLASLIDRMQRDSLVTISRITINSYASPDGGRQYNEQITKKRAKSIYDYLINTFSVADSLVEMGYSGIDWDGLYNLVEKSDMEYRDGVLDIIKNTPEETWKRVNPDDKWLSLVDSRIKQLMDFKLGDPYRYMAANYFSQLRVSSAVSIYLKNAKDEVPIEEVEIEEVVELEEQPLEVVEPVEPEPVTEQTQLTDNITTEAAEDIQQDPVVMYKPLLALKTNLLYDAATLLNIEVEVPINQQWSVAGELVFPWWSSSWKESSKRNCVQLINGNIEGKYWFGDRSDRPVMTGWHLGLYAGGGLYDLEHKKVGYQGEFFIAAGLSGGYAHTINKSGNLRLEYSLAAGYLKTDYDKYAEHLGIDNAWHTIRQERGKYTWIGPTRVRVSLVWMLNRKVNMEK